MSSVINIGTSGVSLGDSLIDGSNSLSINLTDVLKAKTYIQAADGALQLLKRSLEIAYKTTSIAANVTDLCSTKSDGLCIPSVKECYTLLVQTLKSILDAKFLDAKQKVNDFIDALSGTNCDDIMQTAIKPVLSIVDVLVENADEILYKYTGLSYNEVKNKALAAFQLLSLIKRIKRAARNKQSGTENMSEDDAGSKLKTYLEAQGVLITNAFVIIQIKDMAMQILEKVQGIGNHSTSNFDEFVNTLADIVSIFDILGIKSDSQGITLEDMAILGLATFGDITSVNISHRLSTFQSMVNQTDTICYEYAGTNNGVISLTIIDEFDMSLIIDLIDNVLLYNGKPIFNARAKALIISKLKKVWNDNLADFVIGGYTDGVYREFTFNVKRQIKTKNSDIHTTSTADYIDNSKNQFAALDKALVLAIIGDKILIFDPIVLMLKLFIPVIELLRIISKLLKNYETNKARVKQDANLNVFLVLCNGLQTVLGLCDKLGFGGKNFYVVRTKKLADHISSNYHVEFDTNGYALLSIPDTVKLITYLTTHGNIVKQKGKCALSGLKKTILYYDNYGILTGKYNDGTTECLSGLEIDPDNETVYYDKKHRPVGASLIIQAISRKEDALDNQFDIYNEPSNIIDILTVLTDEMEGLQSISMADMNLCHGVEGYDDNDYDSSPGKEGKSDLHAIIEFGVEHTLGLECKYELMVKPGLVINANTILAKITRGDKTEFVKSIFDYGVVRADDQNNTDFAHFFKNSCNRHIIIDDYEMGMGCAYSLDDIDIMRDKFKESTSLASMIMNNMPYSVLSDLICNRIPSFIFSNISNTYDRFVDDVNDVYEDYKKKIVKNGDGDAINKTKGNPDQIKNIGDNMLNLRMEMINKVIKLYNDAANIHCFGKVTYKEAKNLAYDKGYGSFKAGSYSYHNYYFSLLNSIDIESDTAWAKRYYRLISDIIDYRMGVEGHDIMSSIADFNTMFNTIYGGTKIESPYNMLDKLIVKDADYQTVIDTLKEQFAIFKMTDDDRTVVDALDASEKPGWYVNKYSELSGKDTTINSSLKQIANMFLFLRRTHVPGQYKPSANKNTEPKTEAEMVIDALIDGYNNIIESADIIKEHKDSVYHICGKTNETGNEFVDFQFIKMILDKVLDLGVLSIIDGYLPDIDGVLARLHKLENHEYAGMTDALYEVEIKHAKDLLEYLNNAMHLAIALLKSSAYELGRNFDRHIGLVITNDVFDVDNSQVRDNLIWILDLILDQTFSLTAITIPEYIMQFCEDKHAKKLIMEEREKLRSFWNEAIDAYHLKYDIQNIINEFSDYANSLTANALWPESVDIYVKHVPYQLFTFLHRFDDTAKDGNNDIVDLPEISEPVAPTEGTVDMDFKADIKDPDTSTLSMFDYKYWLIYMANATLFTCIPIFWSDGFDMPPFMVPIILPAVYFPVAPPVYIKPISVLLVFGIAIRGIWPAPIVLTLNLSNNDINALLPVMIAMNLTKKAFQMSLTKLENKIPLIMALSINLYLSRTADSLKQIERLNTINSQLQHINIKDEALIENDFKLSWINTNSK